MSTSPLSIDVYVAPMRPYTYPDQLGEGEVATWAPSSSTLWPSAASPALPRGSRVRGSGGCRSRRLGGGVQQDEQVLDVALPGRTPRDVFRFSSKLIRLGSPDTVRRRAGPAKRKGGATPPFPPCQRDPLIRS